MQRITITLDDPLSDTLDAHMARRGYDNRSEAIRDLIRDALERDRVAAGEAPRAVATLTYVYDHAARDLARRVTHHHHDHHDLAVSTLHVHLDHDNCLEVAVLRGPTPAIRHFAEHVMAERGVHHGRLHIVPVDEKVDDHRHGGGHGSHTHSRPLT